ncbi:hypothetical protein F5B20DRAFT_387701 [Whalleya microplaca]|nr:hypothetical protein F5B20DRAFT_387701 [Whalleya microplaca]
MANTMQEEPKTNPQTNNPPAPYEVAGNNITQPPAAYQSPGHHTGPQRAPPYTNAIPVLPMPLASLGTLPALIDCPFCNSRCQTRIQEEDSSMTIVAGIGMGLICLCLACIPCLAHWCQDVDHFCSICNQRVAHVPYNGITQPVHPTPIPQGYNMGTPLPPVGSQPPPPQQKGQQQGAYA